MSFAKESDHEYTTPLVDEADLILPTETLNLDSNVEPPTQIVADEVEAVANGEPLYEDSGPASIGILNAFTGIFDKPSLPRDGISLPTTEIRPFLRREGSRGQNTAPPAPVPPPEAPPPPLSSEPESTEGPQDIQNGADSLSLQQLRALVREMPGKAEPAPYAFVYGNKASMMEELEEWFSYGIEERTRIAKTHSSFGNEWNHANGFKFTEDAGSPGEASDWGRASNDKRRKFIRELIQRLNGEGEARTCVLETLVYLALGCWHETAGVTSDGWMEAEFQDAVHRSASEESLATTGGYMDRKEESRKMLDSRYNDSGAQIKWIRANVFMILEAGGAQALIDVFKATVDRECDGDLTRPNITAIQRDAEQRGAWCAATLLYIALEVVQSCPDTEKRLSLRKNFVQAKPNILVFLGDVINSLRWDETIQLPLVKILLLTWKATLVLLGGLEDIAEVKESFQEKDFGRDKTSKPIITASPLDYHSFRQEITSKYPAYVPPTGKFPLEPGQKSMLPPLRQNHNQLTSSYTAPVAQHGSSIFHQPVHIATPAPSPPPSPAAGKGGKKQNYQTNQMFPFLYPPLDATSNSLGGRGTTFMQDSLVGRRWNGADIPVSIAEASELFSSRVRATRALTQLYDAREEFMRYERGWIDEKDKDVDVANLDLDSAESDDGEVVDGPVKSPEIQQRTIDGSVQDRLETVEEFYRDGLPHLQSIVVVVLKTILSTLTSLITNPTGASTTSIYENGNGTQTNGTDGNANGQYDLSNLSPEELELLRTQEITAKAASGLILLLLKWFKVSHVLKFEYLCQLLVDANYVPIILKLLQSQEMERIVNCKADRAEFDLFRYCHSISRNPPLQNQSAIPAPAHQPVSESSSEDECAPPPIIKRRRDADMPPPPPPSNTQTQFSQPPEVDELGLPTTELPSTPITHFSWRNFFSSINFLRVLQKTCKHKAHRNLMLVQYKSAAYLKKALRVPQRELRLYTLKLFKNQVPYCGRKWRQGNMRVITAVYLHCRPELRDDWLLSADVDADVELAVPMEQSLRALTHYYNLKHFSEKMGPGIEGFGLEERDFFERELDKLEWVDEEVDHQDQQEERQLWESGFEHL